MIGNICNRLPWLIQHLILVKHPLKIQNEKVKIRLNMIRVYPPYPRSERDIPAHKPLRELQLEGYLNLLVDRDPLNDT